MLNEAQDLIGIADLVIIPGDHLHKGVGQGDTGLGVEDRGVGVAQEVGGNHSLVGIIQNTLQLTLGGLLHGGADLVVGGRLLQIHGQIHHGDIQRGDTHGHTGELAVQAGNDLAHGLGSAGGAGDDIAGGGTAATPVLHGHAVHRFLGGGGGVNGGHQAVGNAEVIVQDLGHGSQTVGGAAGVGDEGHVGGVGVLIDAHDEHGGIILGGGGHHHVLGTSGDVAGGLLLGQEQARGLDDVLGADLLPGQVGRVTLSVHGDTAAIDDNALVAGGHVGLEPAVHGVVLQHICQIVGRAKVVDAHDLDLRVLQAAAQDHTADPAKSIDTNFNAHHENFLSDGIYQTYGMFSIICTCRKKIKPFRRKILIIPKNP
jgi:hypothetical protein